MDNHHVGVIPRQPLEICYFLIVLESSGRDAWMQSNPTFARLHLQILCPVPFCLPNSSENNGPEKKRFLPSGNSKWNSVLRPLHKHVMLLPVSAPAEHPKDSKHLRAAAPVCPTVVSSLSNLLYLNHLELCRLAAVRETMAYSVVSCTYYFVKPSVELIPQCHAPFLK